LLNKASGLKFTCPKGICPEKIVWPLLVLEKTAKNINKKNM
jgi:hypothetical protein